MTDSEKAEFTVAAFEALLGEKQDRLNRGFILRQAMHDAIGRGEQPRGYRPVWLKECSLTLIEILQAMAEEFDLDHPDDKASVSDLLDILATTSGLLKNSARD